MTGGGRGGKSFTDAMHEMIYNVEVGIIMQILGWMGYVHTLFIWDILTWFAASFVADLRLRYVSSIREM